MTSRIPLRPAGRASKEALASLQDISLTYSGLDGGASVEVLRGVGLSVSSGQLVCVAGRSGSGKSTLLGILSGLLRPTSGLVKWMGQHVWDMTEADRRRWRHDHVGLVFQNGGLVESLTAIENVALAAVPRGVGRLARDRALLSLGMVGITGRSDAFPAQLSGGEQQRVGIARALFAEPSLLIIDEPTANLDRATSDGMIELLVALQADGAGLAVASHDQHLIAQATTVLELE
jgi:lipoprotein-releasing system ATP-binding protein